MFNINRTPEDRGPPREPLSKYDVRKKKFLEAIKAQAIKRAYSKVAKYSTEPLRKKTVASSLKNHKPLDDITPDDMSDIEPARKTEDISTGNMDSFETKSTSENKRRISRSRSFVLPINKTSRMSEGRESEFVSLQNNVELFDETKRKRSSLYKIETFHKHIMSIARINRQKGKPSKFKILLSERETNLDIFQKVNILRYKENVFKAASRLTTSLPPFPRWAYKNKPHSKSNTLKFNVSGTLFEIFDATLMNIPHTKLAENYLYHSKDSTIYFDRDASCFNAVLNFYRTGRLHAPASSCLSFFQEELLFWGINEDLMEPCCYSDYQANKKTCDALDRYMESMKKPLRQNQKTTFFEKTQQHFEMISLSLHTGIFSRWYVVIYVSALVTTLITMIFSTTTLGRIDKETEKIVFRSETESLATYFTRTDINPTLRIIDICLNAFFCVDFLTRFICCYNKVHFFADILNWVDLLVIISSILADMPSTLHSYKYETYPLFLKVPRLFRVFRMSKNIRIGMDAFVLTLQGSSSELMLVFIIFFIAICFYGVLVYVVEMVNEVSGRTSTFKSIFDGMWWAVVTMATIGYGDIVPTSSYGYIVGYFSILTGIIITQLPVPIFLKNFSELYNQIQARMQLVETTFSANIDLESHENDSAAVSSSKSSAKKEASPEGENPKKQL